MSADFQVRFNSKPANAWKFIGRGELHIEPAELRLSGRRHRWFLPGVRQEAALPLSQIHNVSQTGRLVSFAIKTTGTPPARSVVFAASSVEAARQIATLLPQEKTPEFAKRTEEAAAFNAALARVSPRAFVTPTLVAVNVAVFAAMANVGGGVMVPNGPVLLHYGSNFGPFTLGGEWWRLLTSTFLHFGIMHLLFNMWALWSLGQLTERLIGALQYLLLYVFAGLCGSIASLYWHPFLNSAGASGAIFGVLGGLLAIMVNPRSRIPPSVATAQSKSALAFVAYNLLNGITHAGIDNAAHIGGLAGGFAMAWFLARPLTADAHEHVTPPVALVAATAGLVLAGLLWPLQTPDRGFLKAFGEFAVEEPSLLSQQRGLESSIAARSMQPRDLSRQSQVLSSRWRAAQERIDAHEVHGRTLGAVQRQLDEYLAGQALGLNLLGEAEEHNDPDKREWAQQVLDRAPPRIKALQDSTRQHLPALLR